MGMPLESGEDRGHHLMRATPEGSFASKLTRGTVGKEELASFLTGIGFYESNDARRAGEMYDGKDK